MSVSSSANKNKDSFLSCWKFGGKRLVNSWFFLADVQRFSLGCAFWGTSQQHSVDYSEFRMNLVFLRQIVLWAPNVAKPCVVSPGCGFCICKTENRILLLPKRNPDIDFHLLQRKSWLFCWRVFLNPALLCCPLMCRSCQTKPRQGFWFDSWPLLLTFFRHKNICISVLNRQGNIICVRKRFKLG